MKLRSVYSLISSDLAVDLGTASTLVFAKGRGIVCNEPSIVAVHNESRKGKKKVIAIGTEAKNMAGRSPDKISTVKPLRGGVISDFEITEEMLRYLIRKSNRSSLVKPKIVVCVPPGITEVEKRAVKEAAYSAGAREVFLIPEPIAAAIGAGLPVSEAAGNLLLDIGGGSSEISMLSLKGIVYSRSILVGGDKMDEAIISFIKRKFNILIGDRTAEQVKLNVGSAYLTAKNGIVEVSGRDLVLGIPRTFIVSERDAVEALSECVYQIAEMVKSALEKIPPELSADVYEKGMYLTGGGSLLKNLGKFISDKTKLSVTVVDKPFEAVVLGSGIVLSQPGLLEEIMIH